MDGSGPTNQRLENQAAVAFDISADRFTPDRRAKLNPQHRQPAAARRNQHFADINPTVVFQVDHVVLDFDIRVFGLDFADDGSKYGAVDVFERRRLKSASLGRHHVVAHESEE